MAKLLYRSSLTPPMPEAVATESAVKGTPLSLLEGDYNFKALNDEIATKASLVSPTFAGTPTAPTAAPGTNNTQVATTEFVLDAINVPIVAPETHAAASKDTPVDDDELGYLNSASGFSLVRMTYANLKSWVRNIALTGLSTATNAVITAADTVIVALGKLQKQISDHLADTTDAHAASAISNTPAGGISATNVQGAIDELDAEKFPKSGGDIAGNINFTGTARRIQVPEASVPIGNRTLFQSSSTNASTYIGVLPNGTARAAGITFSNSSDPDNAGYGYISMSDVEMLITSGIALGTGGTGGLPGAVPLALTGRNASMRIGDGAVVPALTNAYDLGSVTNRWRNIYTQDLHLSNGIGDYTMIEGEENLYLVNNKNGKHFKFALIEVDASEVPAKSESANGS